MTTDEAFLIQMKQFFEGVDILKKNLTEEIQRTEDITQDLLHELELSSLNAVEIMAVAKELKAVRQERRKYKDELAKVNTLKGFTDKYNSKMIVGDIIQVIKNLKTLKTNQDNRTYNVKILKNLKCAEEKNGQIQQ